MNEGKSTFSQLISFLPDREFRRCVAQYGGDRYIKKLSCWEQYLAMAFAQLTYRESLRDIEACLGAVGPKLYHICSDWRLKKGHREVDTTRSPRMVSIRVRTHMGGRF
jgi:hypothetical protein